MGCRVPLLSGPAQRMARVRPTPVRRRERTVARSGQTAAV